MMINYGTKKKLKFDKELGEMFCENCGHRVQAAVAHETGYHYVVFIPVLPYSGAKMIFCPNCGIMRTLTKEEFKAKKQA